MGEQKTLKFKLDTGAEVTAISHHAYQQLLQPPPLSTPEKVLYGPSRQPLEVLSQCQIDLTYKERSCKQEVFVVEGLKNNLLGLPAITSLNLAVRLDETSLATTDIRERFPQVFERLGNLGEAYEIKLKPNAVPYSLSAQRHVPLATEGQSVRGTHSHGGNGRNL